MVSGAFDACGSSASGGVPKKVSSSAGGSSCRGASAFEAGEGPSCNSAGAAAVSGSFVAAL